LTPSNGCSKRTSRRSSPAAAGLLAALVLAGLLLAGPPPSPVTAQSVDLSVSRRSGALHAGVRFHWGPVDALAGSLRDGLESRITFTVRLYERRAVPFLFGSDRLVMERTVVRSALWDFLGQSFVVESDAGTRSSYSTVDALLEGFFTLADLVLPAPGSDRAPRRYIVARAQFEPVALAPPLSLVTLVGAAATDTTPWARQEAP